MVKLINFKLAVIWLIWLHQSSVYVCCVLNMKKTANRTNSLNFMLYIEHEISDFHVLRPVSRQNFKFCRQDLIWSKFEFWMSEALSNTKSGKFKHVQKKESMKRPSSPLLTRSSRAVLMVGYACSGHLCLYSLAFVWY